MGRIDMNRNNGKAPGNYGYGVIYINPQKKDFIKRFKNILNDDKYFQNKEVNIEEEKLIKENQFNYKKLEAFINRI